MYKHMDGRVVSGYSEWRERELDELCEYPVIYRWMALLAAVRAHRPGKHARPPRCTAKRQAEEEIDIEVVSIEALNEAAASDPDDEDQWWMSSFKQNAREARESEDYDEWGQTQSFE